jgi:ParB-like chromosome segregation protein Spo0J
LRLRSETWLSTQSTNSMAAGFRHVNDGAEFTLPLERVLEDRNFNVRLFYGDIDQLAIQLMTEGQHDPIKVRREQDQFFIVDGHRRQRAFARSRQLRIEQAEDKYFVFEGDRSLGEVSGPIHRSFNAESVHCRQVDPFRDRAELFCSQLIYNSGKPFTLLERMIFISRLSRNHFFTKEQLALKTGCSRTHIANAQALNAADPRLLDFVREGRISQKLALRLLKVFSSEDQIGRVQQALALAEKRNRDKVLPKDFQWDDKGEAGLVAPDQTIRLDPVRVRLRTLSFRLEDAMRFPPNPAAKDRLGTLELVQRYAIGKLSYARLVAYLLGWE